MEYTPGAADRIFKKVKRVFTMLVLLAILGAAAWTWGTLTFKYSTGERAGFLQKISKKGWLFKTWEGELAMVNLPGAMPEIFPFSVRDDKIAQELMQRAGQRVSLTYDQHRYIPTNWFGETDYFVVKVTPLGEAPRK